MKQKINQAQKQIVQQAVEQVQRILTSEGARSGFRFYLLGEWDGSGTSYKMSIEIKAVPNGQE